MGKFKLSQSKENTAYLKFPKYEDAEFGIISDTIRISSVEDRRLDYDVLIHIGKDGNIVGIEIMGE